MRSALYRGEVRHTRLRPKAHHFRYAITSWLVDLDELDYLNRWWPLLGVNRSGLMQFCERDYGPAGEGALKTRISALMQAQGLAAPARIQLLCNPRAFGYGFNSLAVYFTFTADDKPLATLFEVSNTRGEQHLYIAPADAGGGYPQAAKAMYVSPFIPMASRYQFHTQIPEQRFRVTIHQQDDAGHLFSASWHGTRKSLGLRTLLRELLRPMALKTTLAIHWEALRLWLKGVPLQPFDRTGRYQISFAHLHRESNHETR